MQDLNLFYSTPVNINKPSSYRGQYISLWLNEALKTQVRVLLTAKQQFFVFFANIMMELTDSITLSATQSESMEVNLGKIETHL